MENLQFEITGRKTLPPCPAAGGYDRRDVRQIAVHALQHSFGVPVRAMHPAAEQLVADGAVYTLADAAEAALELHAGPGAIPPSGDAYRTIVRALSASDFATVVEQTVRGVSQARQSEALADIVAVSAQLEVPSYQAESYSAVDLKDLPAPGADTAHTFHPARVITTGETYQVFSTFARILITQQALVNGEERGMIEAAVAAFSAAAHRNEMATIAALVESTSNLQDGSPLFHADNANLVTAALDASGLGTAFGTLRAQPTEGGDPSDAAPALLLVHADDEAAALALTQNLPEGRRPRVVATARLSTSASWYVMANPQLYPVIGRARLRGADTSAVSFGPFEPAVWRDRDGKTHEYPGVALPASHSVGFSVLSRIGAVKCNKS